MPAYTCDPASATDQTAQSTVTIDFGGSLGLVYSPNCVKVKAGTVVTFVGAFSSHPLRPGDTCTLDASGTSPITSTGSGSSQSFTFTNPGTYPYFCQFHCGSGMNGAVYVVP